MPFFFIMSGYCCGDRNYELGFKKYFIKYTKSLFVPALIVRALYYLVGMAPFDYAAPTWVKSLASIFLLPTMEWFMMALFFSKLLFYWVRKLVDLSDDPGYQRIVSLFVIALAFYAGETWNRAGLHDWPAWFPAMIDCTLIALSFVTFGDRCKKENIAAIYEKHKAAALTGGGIAVLMILWLIRFQSYTNVSNMAFGNSSISYYVFACVISLYTIALCRRVTEVAAGSNIVLRAVALLGRNTMTVYPGHTIIFFLLNQSIYKITGKLYVPMHDFKTSLIFVYFIVSVAILLLVCYTAEKMKQVIKARNCGTICALAGIAVLALAFGLRAGLSRYQAVHRAPDEAAAVSDAAAGSDLAIDSVEDLLAFRDSVNAGTDYEGCTVVQSADIDLSGIENFEPIGLFGSDHYFCGTYDGAGHSIFGLHIAREDNCALFPILGGTVCNLTIESGSITGACAGSFASHATSDGQARIINCINRAAVHGTIRAGGIADNFNGQIANCINTGSVQADSGTVGGIVSYSAQDIRSSYSSVAPLFPVIFSFKGNGLLSGGEENLTKSYNFRLGREARAEKLSLTPIEITGDVYAHSQARSVPYALGQVWYYIISYWIDAVLWVGIAVLVIKAGKLRRAWLSSPC